MLLKKYSKQKRNIAILAYLFILPSLSLIILFKLYPLIVVLKESFFNVSYLSGQKRFVGLQNYVHIFTDSTFWNSVWITLKLNLFINPVQIAVAVLMAVLINLNFRGKKFYRALFFIPLGVSLAVATTYWSLIFSPGNGIMNYVLHSAGMKMQPFFNDPNQALWIIILIASWKGCSFWMLFILAGLQNIPTELYEAGKVDGLTSFGSFFKITLPLLSRTLLFVLVSDTAANFMMFTPIYMVTKGGPNGSTSVLMYEAYQASMIQGDMGHGMAMITFLMLMLSIVVYAQFRLNKDPE